MTLPQIRIINANKYTVRNRIVFAIKFCPHLLIASLVVASGHSKANSVIDEACPGAAEWRKSHALTPTDNFQTTSKPELREKLLLLAEKGQRVRAQNMSVFDSSRRFQSAEDMRTIDEENYREVKRMIDETGFPSEDEIGKDGVFAAWLIVQHAANDPAFQYKVLRMIEPRVASGEISGEQYALLFDRISILYFHRKQKYGTQIYPGGSEAIPLPIEDEDQVDARRRTLGLMPLADYRCMTSVTERPSGK